ncbi:DUF3939 domain-containing protein [Ammoniphilus sp. CFH 90114]|uniref:DUF3939 domain-containing protein n=1 Tax=Ammoniphilus sp. CFH 90114 TaxID=2493665 RepID=UPI0013E90B4A|nr:DUF3939 domain-containing protein [Ammoniphilus sp. CFH 90114]
MLNFIKKWFGSPNSPKPPVEVQWPVKDISIGQVRKAAAAFLKEKPEGIPFSVLIKDDHEIDYTFLTPYLKAIPRQTYYMSRETYEIFEDRNFAKTIDKIQRAVDDYVDMEGKFPIQDGNPEMKICYMKLRSYLNDTPSFETYLTADENLITWRKPILQ